MNDSTINAMVKESMVCLSSTNLVMNEVILIRKGVKFNDEL